ncbi:hypothetical protein EYF80_038592 [Liparis tanakae]|uniref:Uncharacterized protein n=1 Tax=Liparis tanakae TaxID=230148 RepID=A0A4Z2GCD3_9TELE|nr:hypothetical protein EYF80_038592 [Liparis tanakae]
MERREQTSRDKEAEPEEEAGREGAQELSRQFKEARRESFITVSDHVTSYIIDQHELTNPEYVLQSYYHSPGDSGTETPETTSFTFRADKKKHDGDGQNAELDASKQAVRKPMGDIAACFDRNVDSGLRSWITADLELNAANRTSDAVGRAAAGERPGR